MSGSGPGGGGRGKCADEQLAEGHRTEARSQWKLVDSRNRQEHHFHIGQRVGKHPKNVWAIWFHLFSSEYSNLDLIHIRQTKDSRTRTRCRALSANTGYLLLRHLLARLKLALLGLSARSFGCDLGQNAGPGLQSALRLTRDHLVRRKARDPAQKKNETASRSPPPAVINYKYKKQTNWPAPICHRGYIARSSMPIP